MRHTATPVITSCLMAFGSAAWAAQPFQESAGQVVIEAESYEAKVDRNGQAWATATSQAGFGGSGYLQALPNTNTTRNSGYTTASPELSFNVQFSATGTYYVWVRGSADGGNDDSLHAGVDGTGPSSADRLSGFTTTGWVWKNTTMDGVPATLVIPTAGLHTIHLWMREDGLRVDRLLLRTSSSATAPAGAGPAESARVPAEDTTAPVISNVAVSGITTAGATVTWTTDEPATSQVEYGTDASYGQSTPLDPALVTSHSVTLSGLSPSTEQHFCVHSVDAANNPAASSNAVFTTADPLPPGTGAFLESNGEVVIEAEHFDAHTPRNGKDWLLETIGSSFSGDGHMTALPNSGTTNNTGYVAASPELAYNVQFATAGTYHVWVRGWGISGSDDSIHAGLDGTGPDTADRMSGFSNSWQWSRTTMDGVPATLIVPSPGLHTVHLWMREDGFRVDKLLLRMDASSTVPSGAGPPESPRSDDPVDLDPPVPSDVAAVFVTTTTATIVWTTDEPASSQVEYGSDTNYGLSTPLQNGPMVSHAVVVTGLTPGTTVHLRARSVDASDNEGLSDDLAIDVPAVTPGAAAITILSPAQESVFEAGPQVAEFAVQNHTLGDQGEPHLHFYLEDDPVPYHFFNGVTQEVLYQGAHTHAVHWWSTSSIRLQSLNAGRRTARFVLANGDETELTNPEAMHTLALNLTPPPPGVFQLDPMLVGLEFPVAMATAPDGRIFFNEMSTGRIRVVHPGWQLQAEPFYQLDVAVDMERGLIGIALDLDFAANGYVYVFNTIEGNPDVNRVVRLTDVNSLGTEETVLIDNLPAGNGHNGGTIAFGPDGKLYISIGDTNQPPLAQDLSYYGGKILRYNKDGTIPGDNPIAGSPVYALGMRNTFDFTFHPHTGTLLASENGPEVDDEINPILPGGNYGWPNVTGIANDPAYVDPLLSVTPPVGPTGIVAIAEDSAYPEEFHNDLLWTNFNEGSIHRIRLAGPELNALGDVSVAYGGGQGFLLDLAPGPDGYLYATSGSGIFRIVPRAGISDVAATGITPTSATISWTTVQPATSQVEYGVDAAYGQSTPVDPSLVTSHSVILTSLTPGTLYHLLARSVDGEGNAMADIDRLFVTATGQLDFLELSGQVVMEAEHHRLRTPRSGKDWVAETALSGFAGSGYLTALPNPETGTNQTTDYTLFSPELIFNVHFTTPGTYAVWVRGAADNTADDSIHAGIDGAGPDTADHLVGFGPSFGWSHSTLGGVPASLVVPSAGPHTVHLWMREDGFHVDRLLLRTSTSSNAPPGQGPAESPTITPGPPAISSVAVSNVTASGATVTWLTDEVADSHIEYGVDATYGQTAPVDPALVTSHSITLSGLAADTEYHLRALSIDVTNQEGVSGDMMFTTTETPSVPAAFLESGGQVVMEAESYDAAIARNSHAWTLATATTGFAGAGYMEAAPNSGTGVFDSGYTTASAELAFSVQFSTTGTYYVWLRASADTTKDDSVHAGVDGIGPTSADRIGNFQGTTWLWKRNTMDGVPATLIIPSAGLHTIHLWMREDGLRVDRLLLRKSSSSTAPSGAGPAESPRTP